MADRLNDRYGDRARIIHGDGTNTGLPADHFTSVVCFTMLHHVPSAAIAGSAVRRGVQGVATGLRVRRW